MANPSALTTPADFTRRVLKSEFFTNSHGGLARKLHLDCGHAVWQDIYCETKAPKFANCKHCGTYEAMMAPRALSDQERLIADYHRNGGPLMATVRRIMEAEGA